jgi:hypothetical protein
VVSFRRPPELGARTDWVLPVYNGFVLSVNRPGETTLYGVTFNGVLRILSVDRGYNAGPSHRPDGTLQASWNYGRERPDIRTYVIDSQRAVPTDEPYPPYVSQPDPNPHIHLPSRQHRTSSFLNTLMGKMKMPHEPNTVYVVRYGEQTVSITPFAVGAAPLHAATSTDRLTACVVTAETVVLFDL